MKKQIFALSFGAMLFALSFSASAQPGHFPSRDTWEKRKPADVGMD